MRIRTKDKRHSFHNRYSYSILPETVLCYKRGYEAENKTANTIMTNLKIKERQTAQILMRGLVKSFFLLDQDCLQRFFSSL